MLAHVGEREGLEADGVFSGGGIKGTPLRSGSLLETPSIV